MQLAFGLHFADLHNIGGLRQLDQIFLTFLSDHDQHLYEMMLSLRSNPEEASNTSYSDFLLKIAPILDDFLAELFAIKQEVTKLRYSHKEFNIIYECKRKFVQRIALKKYPPERLEGIDFQHVSKSLKELLGDEFTQTKFAYQVLEWLSDDILYSNELDLAAQYSALAVYNNTDSILFSIPHKKENNSFVDCTKIAKYSSTTRVGFDYFDPLLNLDTALNATHYCIYCHKQEKDSCSKGLSYNGVLQKNGCPLKQKISEMNYVKARGFNLASLAIIIIDNPMVAATGHRICNDCSNACIYQKQDPVDIPLVESNILETTLLLPYGVEIYLLLTRWNPLNIFAPLPKPASNYKVLVIGLGPAGLSLSYYLSKDGHNVVAIDGLKINPLDFDINKPIKHWLDYKEDLSKRTPMGFGGVAEYGITSRWDKNNLTILRLILQRNSNIKLLGGVSLGSNITVEQAFELGFDHIALCAGAGKPKIVQMENFLAKGVRTASDFLMTLQSGGAFLEKSITNLLIRMPIVVIGGGLTSIDVATESLNYYKVQVEKFYKQYELSIQQNGRDITERNWTEEDRIIAQEFIEHAILFKQAKDKKEIQHILNQLGGASIYYRRKFKYSPAYNLNPEEVMYAIAAGINLVEEMMPLAINVDEYGYAESIEFENLGVRKKVRARSIIIAVGTEANAYTKEYLENNMTFFGDCNPQFAGSVVKALASSKEGYKLIGRKLKENKASFSGSYQEFFEKIDYLLTSRIHEINILSDKVIELVIHSPLAANNFQPGQFFRMQNYSQDISHVMEPLALTGAYVDKEKNLIHLIILESGQSSKICRSLKIGEQIALMGPTGLATKILTNSNVVLIGGGLGNASLLPIAKALKDSNCTVQYFAAYKNLQDRFYQEKIEDSSNVVVWCCEEGILTKNRPQDLSLKGNIIDCIKVASQTSSAIDMIICIGSSGMMEAVQNIKSEYFGKKAPLIISVNAPMQCMMKGICGQCIQQVKDKRGYVFVCACQDQEAETIDFSCLKDRLSQNSLLEKILR
jgi:NADPH-dependent glutamate synthase beta subunit-like oxidoreductase/NAD(P)H-flavin reductase